MVKAAESEGAGFLMWPGDNPGSLEMRRRIAMQMLSQGKKGYPKTLGEGLSSIGDALGDIGMMKMLERQAAQEKAAGEAAASKIPEDPDAAPASAAPAAAAPGKRAEDDTAPAQRTAMLTPAEPATEPAAYTPPPAPAPTPIPPSTLSTPPTPPTPPTQAAVGSPMPGLSPAITMALNTPNAAPAQSWGRTRGIDMRDPASFPGPDAARADINPQRVALGTGDPQSYFPSGRISSNVAPWLYDQVKASRDYAAAPGLNQTSQVAQGVQPVPGAVSPELREAGLNTMREAMQEGTPDQGGRLAYSFGRLAPQTAGLSGAGAAPMTPQDAAQARVLAETTGMGSGGGGYSYAPTASLNGRAGGPIQNDAAPITGISPKVGAGVSGTVEQMKEQLRNSVTDRLMERPPEVPQPNPTQAGVFPPTTETRLPASTLAAIQAGSPSEAAGNRPIIVPDIKPQPAEPAATPGAQMAQAKLPEDHPDYAMPKPVPPDVPPMPKMSDRERIARQVKKEGLINGNATQVQRAQDAIDEEKVKSDYEKGRLVTKYNADVQHYQQLDSAYQTWLANDFARRTAKAEEARKVEEHTNKMTKAPAELTKLQAEAAKAQAEADAGKVPTTKEINGVTHQYDPVTKTWIPPPGSTTKPYIEATEGQSKDVAYYERGRRALHNMGDGANLHNWVQWYGSGIPVVGNALFASPEFQQQYNGAKEFASIALRKETGQGANASEVADIIQRYVPKPGSSQALIDQMARSREAVLEGIKDGLGKATPIVDRFDQRFAEEVKAQKEAEKIAKETGKSFTIGDLPPAVISSKEEKDALPIGRKYRLPTDGPDVHRVKQSHD